MRTDREEWRAVAIARQAEVARLTETLDRVRALCQERGAFSAVAGEVLALVGPAPADPDERAGDGR